MGDILKKKHEILRIKTFDFVFIVDTTVYVGATSIRSAIIMHVSIHTVHLTTWLRQCKVEDDYYLFFIENVSEVFA